MKYAIDQLSNSASRADKALSRKNKKYNSERIGNFDKLIQNLPKLIRENKIYVGFVGGKKKLKNTSIDDLVKRDYYKVSLTKWSENWIRLDSFLEHYFNQKYSNQEVIEIKEETEIA